LLGCGGKEKLLSALKRKDQQYWDIQSKWHHFQPALVHEESSTHKGSRMKGGFFIPIRSIVLASEGSSATIAFNNIGRLTPMSQPVRFQEIQSVQQFVL
jgi:hypothetical protein